MAITFTRKTWVDYQEGPYLEASELNRFESALDALVNGTSRAVRLDGDTMTGGLTLSAGNLNVGAGDIRTAGTSRISNTGRFDATSIYNTALTSGRVVRVGAGGQLVDDAGLTTTQSSGKTLTLLIGDGSADTASPALTLDGYSGSSYPAVNFRSVGNTRTTLRWENSEDRFAVVMRNDDGSARNTPIFIPRTSATSMEFGGAELQPATFKGTVTVNGGLADGQMVHSGANGLLRSDAGLTYSRVSSITRRVIVGDGSVGSHTTVALRRSAGYRTAYEFLTEDGVTRWGTRMSAVSTDYQIVAQDASGNDIDVPVAIPNAAGSAIVLGGSGGTTRDVNLTKDLLLSGAPRISNTGRFDATSIYNTALTAGRVVRVGTGGQLVDDAGLATTQSNGKTTTLTIGDGSSDTSSPSLVLDGFSGSSYPALNYRSAGFTRVSTRWENEEDRFVVLMRNNDGSSRNIPILIPRTSATPMEFGGAELQPATFKGTVTVNGGLADGQMVHSGANGLLRSDAGLTYSRVSSITRRVIVGDGSVGSHTTVALRRSAGYRTAYEFLTEDGVTRWGTRMSAVSTDYQIVAQDASGNDIDVPVAIPNAAGSAIVLGGSGGTTRDVNLTKDLLLSGARRISAAGAVTATSLSSTDQAGTGERLVSASAAGAQSATTAISAFAKTILDDADAAAVRETIGAGASLGFTPVNKAGDTLTGQLIGPGLVSIAPTFLATQGVLGLARYGLSNTSLAVDQKNWAVQMSGGNLGFYAYNDDWTSGISTIEINRSGKLILNYGLQVWRDGNIEDVVGARKTGWAAATGTPTRTTFATGSVTLEQLAERVKALIDDLTAHGLIGA